MKEENLYHFNNIMDTFTGVDGCIKLMYFRLFIEDLEEKAQTDENAQTLLNLLGQFSRLIDAAQILQTQK